VGEVIIATILVIIGLIVGRVLVGMAVLAVVAISQSGHTFSEMDWNSDGSTSLSELLEAPDIGRRPVSKDGEECIEFFSFKDGMPLRIDCASGFDEKSPTD
jgi:hypothetical protein